MSNPRADEAAALQSQLKQMMGRQYGMGVRPMSLEQMTEFMRNNLTADRAQAISQAGGLATARGYSMGLNNPFGFANRAESQVYDRYAQGMRGLLAGNIDRSFAQQMGAKQFDWNRIAQLYGLRLQNMQNLSTGAWNETIAPLLGAGIGAAGSIYGGGLAGGAGSIVGGATGGSNLAGYRLTNPATGQYIGTL